MLSWTSLNPTCNIKNTTKLYFGKYISKAVIKVPCGRIITSAGSDSDVDRLLLVRSERHYAKRIGWSHWRVDHRKMQDSSAVQLKYWRNVFAEHSNNLKWRIEEPLIQLYSNDENFLFTLVSGNPSALKEIYLPASDQAKEILLNNSIIIKTPSEYNFKIIFKEGYQFLPETKAQLLQYLISLEENVKIPEGVKGGLDPCKYWFTGGYIYAKDDSAVTFLNLIAPGIVRGIFKLHYLP